MLLVMCVAFLLILDTGQSQDSQHQFDEVSRTTVRHSVPELSSTLTPGSFQSAGILSELSYSSTVDTAHSVSSETRSPGMESTDYEAGLEPSSTVVPGSTHTAKQEFIGNTPDVTLPSSLDLSLRLTGGLKFSELTSQTLDNSTQSGTELGHSSDISRVSTVHSFAPLSLDFASITTVIMSTPLLTTAAQAPPFTDFNVTMTSTHPIGTTEASDAVEASMTTSQQEFTEMPQTTTEHNGDGVWQNVTQMVVTPGEKGSFLTEGSIAGIVLGCLAAVFAFSLLMLCFCYKQRRKVQLSPKKNKSGHYTGLFDDSITLSYINCQFEPTKDPIDELTSLDSDAYLNSLEQYIAVQQTWPAKLNTTSTKL